MNGYGGNAGSSDTLQLISYAYLASEKLGYAPEKIDLHQAHWTLDKKMRSSRASFANLIPYLSIILLLCARKAGVICPSLSYARHSLSVAPSLGRQIMRRSLTVSPN